MAVGAALFSFSLILAIIGCNAAGQFSVLQSPDSIRFSGSSRAAESILKEIFSAALGLSVDEGSDWNGLSVVDPFNTPEAVVEVYVDGISNLGNTLDKAKSYQLTVDEYEPDTYDALKHRIKQRFINGGNKLVNIRLDDPNDFEKHADIFGEIPAPKLKKQHYQHLKPTIEEDYQFLVELEALKALTEKVDSGVISADNILDFYNLRFRSLHALSDFHGPNSLQAKEAKQLLGAALQDLSKAFSRAYDGSVLVSVVTTDVAHTRRTRREAKQEQAQAAKANIQDWQYSEDYSAIFNIILWFVVVWSFALIAIVYTIMDMDPGRDSIIYRMTNTRMKKDN